MIVAAHDLWFRYPGVDVLKSVSCQASAGQLLAVLGPNGAGKTTLLHCLGGVLRPDRGGILLEDQDLCDREPQEIARLVAMVPQRLQAGPISVFDAVLLGRRPHLRWRAGQHDLRLVESALRRLGLRHLALRPIDRLSGGELQQVAVARALVQEPRLLLLDEPTSSLDLHNQVALLDLVRRVVDEHQVAAIMSVHDLNLALAYADAFVLLKDGRVLAEGPPASLTAQVIEAAYGLAVAIHEVDSRLVVTPRDAPRRYPPHDHHHH